jgi:peptide/nickel transport system ATP-binding protein
MLLQAEGLTLEYRLGKRWYPAVYDVSLAIAEGEIHGLVGESGSGKSSLALALMRYIEGNARITSGRILFDGQDIAHMSESALSQLWGAKIALVPQNPLDALNPSLKIGAQMAELTRLHMGLSAQEARAHACKSLHAVKIADPERVLERYPHELSGGMQQRVMIAMALSTRPRLLILDEPTTALDVTTQAVILDLVRDLVRQEGASALYVSHNLGTIAQLCDVVTVLYGGEVMATAPVGTLFHQPIHPYTIGLLASLPKATHAHETRLPTIGGTAPALQDRPTGCAFASRCAVAVERCHQEKPALELVEAGRVVRCFRWRDVANGIINPRLVALSAPQEVAQSPAPVLRVRNVSKAFGEFRLLDRLLGRKSTTLKAVQGASLHINARSTLGLVGESGSGKTTLARLIVGLETADEGELELLGLPLSLKLEERDAHALRNLRLILQNPNDALNPYKTVGQAIGRTLYRLDATLSRAERQKRVSDMLTAVGLTPAYASRYPAQLSGGEKQRVAIARAFAARPALIVADEPTSALDVSVQAVILNLLKDLRAREGVSYLIISHDLDVVSYVADWIVVMYLGEIVEQGTTAQVYGTPSHPYTEALLSAIPQPDPSQRGKGIRLEGDVPSPRDKPTGCPFHTRCPRFIGRICETDAPPVRMGEGGHEIRCHHTLEALQALQEAST